MITFDFEGWHSVYDRLWEYDPRVSKNVPEVFVPFIEDYSTDSGGACMACDSAIGSSVVDGDYGVPAERFTWMTLVWTGDAVLTFCEDCSMAIPA